MALAIVLGLAAGLATGSAGFSPSAFWTDLSGGDAGLILGQIRAPRTLGAALAGALLGLSGAIAQGLFRNPLADPGIVRHRGKIEAVINNAARAQELIAEAGAIAAFVWQFEATVPHELVLRPTSPESEALSKALKKRGWRFVGPTTVYAFMQAMGLVNDHAENCASRAKAMDLRKAVRIPGR